MIDRDDNYFDCLVLIGRFQPCHAGHLQVIRAGLERAAMLILICGSARQPRSARNPWDEWEREQMIRGSLTRAENNRIHIAPIMDDLYDEDAWIQAVATAVNNLAEVIPDSGNVPRRIGLIGHNLHNSHYYPRLFPQWEAIEIPDHNRINATTIRAELFGGKDPTAARTYLHGDQARAQLPGHVITTLEQFCGSEAFTDVKAEYDYIERYRRDWDVAPYPPVFVTVDNVVVHGDNILLIERGDHPGKGLLAMPGGFIDQYEPLQDACIRELLEETDLAIPAAELKTLIRRKEVFDYPYRSSRGRIITHVFLIELPPAMAVPQVRGGDDARHALWLPLADLDPVRMLEDHLFIIQKMLAEPS